MSNFSKNLIIQNRALLAINDSIPMDYEKRTLL